MKILHSPVTNINNWKESRLLQAITHQTIDFIHKQCWYHLRTFTRLDTFIFIAY